jgi:hypothetical protein
MLGVLFKNLGGFQICFDGVQGFSTLLLKIIRVFPIFF